MKIHSSPAMTGPKTHKLLNVHKEHGLQTLVIFPSSPLSPSCEDCCNDKKVPYQKVN